MGDEWEEYLPKGNRYTIPELIDVLEYRSQIHETYAGLVLEDKDKWISFGSHAFHMWAIKGYQDAIYYLKGGTEVEKKRWWTSKTVWTNALFAIGVIYQASTGTVLFDAEAQAAVIVVINLILRFVTGKPLGK
jgi:hypothetical protein